MLGKYLTPSDVDQLRRALAPEASAEERAEALESVNAAADVISEADVLDAFVDMCKAESQTEIANACGTKKSFVNAIANGRKQLSADMVARFGMTRWSMLTPSGPMKEELQALLDLGASPEVATFLKAVGK